MRGWEGVHFNGRSFLFRRRGDVPFDEAPTRGVVSGAWGREDEMGLEDVAEDEQAAAQMSARANGSTPREVIPMAGHHTTTPCLAHATPCLATPLASDRPTRVIHPILRPGAEHDAALGLDAAGYAAYSHPHRGAEGRRNSVGGRRHAEGPGGEGLSGEGGDPRAAARHGALAQDGRGGEHHV